MNHVFISHASENHAQAEAIARQLERNNIRAWISPRDIRAGQDWATEILLGIEQCTAMILLLTMEANNSVFVKREVERAISKQKPVIPVRIENVMPSPGLELFVSGSHWIDASESSIEAKLDELLGALSAIGLGKSPPNTPPPPDKKPPRYFLKTVGIATLIVTLVAAWSGITRTDKGHSSIEVGPTQRADGPSSNSAPITDSITPKEPTLAQKSAEKTSEKSQPTKQLEVARKRANDKPVTSYVKEKQTPALAERTTNPHPRCSELLSKTSLGEPLSDLEKNELNATCGGK
jgi:hypothetical protein